MSALGRSGMALSDELKQRAANDVLEGLTKFVSGAADPEVPAFSAPAPTKKASSKH